MRTLVVLGGEQARARQVASALDGTFPGLRALAVWDGFQLSEAARGEQVAAFVCEADLGWAPRDRLLGHLAEVAPGTPTLVWGDEPDPRKVLELLRMGATEFVWGEWAEARTELVAAVVRATGALPEDGKAARVIPLRRPAVEPSVQPAQERSVGYSPPAPTRIRSGLARAQGAEVQREVASDAPLRVLLADASSLLLGMLGQLLVLRTPGAVVRRCTDAAQVEDALREGRFDVLCCASDLPGLSASALRSQLTVLVDPPALVLWTASGHGPAAFAGVPVARVRNKPIDGRTLVEDVWELAVRGEAATGWVVART